MSRVVDKFLNFLGFELVDEEEEKTAKAKSTETKPEESWQPRVTSKRQHREERHLEVVSTPNGHTIKMAVCKPLSFSDVQHAANYLCNNQSTVIDLTGISLEEAQRALDYLSGVVFAINGKASRVGTGIFLFAPANVSIEGAVEIMMEQKSSKQPSGEGEGVSEATRAFLKTLGA